MALISNLKTKVNNYLEDYIFFTQIVAIHLKVHSEFICSFNYNNYSTLCYKA